MPSPSRSARTLAAHLARTGDGQSALALAQRALSALRQDRYDARHALYGRSQLGRFRYATLWPHANAWAASVAVGALDARLLPSPAQALASASCYRSGRDRWPGGLDSAVAPPLGRGGTRYYDDNAWIGLVALRHARQSGESALISFAAACAGFVQSGWADLPGLAEPGGIFWREVSRPRGRNTCANAPATTLFATLGLLGDASWVAPAQETYSWTRRVLQNGEDLYLDHVDPDGHREQTIWSYNQGAMVGAGLLLARLTGEPDPLRDAEATARAALARYGDGACLAFEPPAFAAVFFRNVFALDDNELRAAAVSCARGWIGALARDRLSPSGLVHGRDDVNATAALAEVAALLAGAPAGP